MSERPAPNDEYDHLRESAQAEADAIFDEGKTASQRVIDGLDPVDAEYLQRHIKIMAELKQRKIERKFIREMLLRQRKIVFGPASEMNAIWNDALLKVEQLMKYSEEQDDFEYHLRMMGQDYTKAKL